MNAPLVRLGDVADYIRGITFKPDDKVPVGTPASVVCLRTSNIQEQLDLSDVFSVPHSFVKRDEQRVRPGDILISSANSWNLVGKCVAVPELEFDATAGGFISILRPNQQDVNERYIFHWLRSPVVQTQVRACARQTTNIANLDSERFLNLTLALPPLEEQRRIAAILDKAVAIRRKRQEAIDMIDEAIRSSFLSLVGPAAPSYETWPLTTIESLAAEGSTSMRTGPFGSDLKHSEFIDAGVAVLGIDNAVRNYFAWSERRFISQEKYEKLRRYRVYPGDVIITIMGTTGRSAVVPDDIPLAINTKHLAAITLNRKVALPEFVAHSIHTHPFVLNQVRAAGRGAIMEGLNLTIIKGLKVPLPPLEAQERFVRALEQLRRARSRLLESQNHVTALNLSLTHLAFETNGMSHVPVYVSSK